jgi:hypothetical protein
MRQIQRVKKTINLQEQQLIPPGVKAILRRDSGNWKNWMILLLLEFCSIKNIINNLVVTMRILEMKGCLLQFGKGSLRSLVTLL